MDQDKLETTNQLLHDLERKLSLVSSSSSTYTAQSHGSVVQDPSHSGLARKNIQSSVLQYIKGNTSEFDADRVFSDRQQKFATTFGREYSPSQGKNAVEDCASGSEITRRNGAENEHAPELAAEMSNNHSDEYGDDFDDDFSGDEFHEPRIFGNDLNDLNDSENDTDSDDDMLLPPSPPRSPPREMDPNKLYGLFDFSGPDPSHCTLHRDEPVYLLNDSDNYWWLIRKLNKSERQVLWRDRGSREDIETDEEDGKIGFVPAECLETYGERLARLNCFKNEELERSSRETLPGIGPVSGDGNGDKSNSTESNPQSASQNASPSTSRNPFQSTAKSTSQNTSHNASQSTMDLNHDQSLLGTLTLRRSNSILKKAGAYGPSNKSVTFENLGVIHLDDEDAYDDVIDFSSNYYSVSHEDVSKDLGNPRDSAPTYCTPDSEKHSEVLSDIYPAEAPLQIRKPRTNNTINSDFKDFSQPKFSFSADNGSIGSFSPDTPPTKQFSKSTENADDDESKLRRSVILDRLHIMTSGIEAGKNGTAEPSFGGSLSSHGQLDEDSEGSEYETLFHDDMRRRAAKTKRLPNGDKYDNEGSDDQSSRKSVSAEEVNTPLTSSNSLNCVSGSPKAAPVVEKRKKRPVHDMFSPILGQLDELTERLAELEHSL